MLINADKKYRRGYELQMIALTLNTRITLFGHESDHVLSIELARIFNQSKARMIPIQTPSVFWTYTKMADDLPFKAEYAKSNRSSCKSCKDNISKDSLRLAKMLQSPHFDGKIPHWFHYNCFFKKIKVKASSDISGFDSLRWDDQEKIRGKMDGGERVGVRELNQLTVLQMTFW
ncbi:unnamed protein product [Pocillopora meandrina]|uniref:PARP-type domain-containing protein n=1 Tax=Pocillopora meandrina TaxID=46732 RepID=A0AAU9W108_9CNID|nr:unnamed protein product [Pocillopora meandrina]